MKKLGSQLPEKARESRRVLQLTEKWTSSWEVLGWASNRRSQAIQFPGKWLSFFSRALSPPPLSLLATLTRFLPPLAFPSSPLTQGEQSFSFPCISLHCLQGKRRKGKIQRRRCALKTLPLKEGWTRWWDPRGAPVGFILPKFCRIHVFRGEKLNTELSKNIQVI